MASYNASIAFLSTRVHTVLRPVLRFLACALLGLCASLTAQAQRARLYTLEHGLSSSAINALFLDPSNFVWVATDERLDRFDGYRFSPVAQSDPATGRRRFSQLNALWASDDTRYWLGTSAGLYLYHARENRFQFVPLLGRDDQPDENFSVHLLAGNRKRGYLVAATNMRGNYVIDLKRQRVDSVRTVRLRRLLGDDTFDAMLLDSHERLWTSNLQKELRYADLRSGRTVTPACTPATREALRQGYVTDFLEDPSTGRVYLGVSSYGVFVFDPAGGGVVRPVAGNRDDLFIYTLLLTRDGRLLVGTDNRGLWQLDRQSEQLSPLPLDGMGEVDTRTLKVHSLCEDRDGNVLAGLYQRGLLVLPRSPQRSDYLPLSQDGSGKNSSCVTSFATQSDGTLWTGTDGSGVFATRPDGGTRAANEGLRSLLVQTLAVDAEGRVWCGSWKGGIQVLGPDGVWQTPAYLQSLSNAGVMDLLCDSVDRCIYAALNGGGLIRIKPDEGRVERLFANDLAFPEVVRLDAQRQLWVSDAVYCYRIDSKRQKIEIIKQADGQPIGKAKDFAPLGADMLIGTSDGLYVCDRRSGQLRDVSYARATRGINVMALMPDDSLVWMTAGQSLYCLHTGTGRLLRFQSFGGHYLGEFHKRAALAAPEGWMAIGGDNGALRFLPSDLLRRHAVPGRVFFTAFSAAGHPVAFDPEGGDGQELDADILFASRARLHRGDNSLSVAFGVPSLGTPNRLCYVYQLEGYETIWHEAPSDNPHAYYASLPVGRYTLRVKAYYENADAATDFSEASLIIVVPAPWYATPWAVAVYALLALGVAAVVWRSLRAKHQARLHLRASIHKEQIKEAQLKLFTSIAHELRSPLTLIVSPLSKLIHTDPDPQRQQSYTTMQRNANRLLRIVGQITDVRKIDNGQFQLHFQRVDILSYLADIMDSFADAAASRDIDFTRQTDGTVPEGSAPDLWIDPVHFEKVVVNLLSNAFKFTPTGGRITVRVATKADTTGGLLILSVSNSGSHLSPADLDHLFERFYQSRSVGRIGGSGIGLNLASELVRLHHGSIAASNVTDPDGVEFRVTLPLGSSHLSAEEKQPDPDQLPADTEAKADTEAVQPMVKAVADDVTVRAAAREQLVSDPDEATAPEADAEAATDAASDAEPAAQPAPTRRRAELLLVDDDLQLLDYMRQNLEADYDIHTACSGNQAWKWMLSHRPDAVVTDVMMPDGDGYELCRRIKGNPETSHIAVIVLTSQGTDENRLAASELKVEHFLPKPFDMRLLQASISQVLSVREALIGKMRRAEVEHDYESVTVESADESLLRRVHDCVMNHLDDPEFGVEQLAQEVGISRVHLNRRLRQLYNVSPGAYIRNIRLKQAAYLLVNNRVNVSDVAWKVGFSSLSYFSANFRKHFGMSPKEFVAAYDSNDDHDEVLRKLLQ